MIVFLTICYCAVLALLVKLGVIKLNLWWKLSPLAWMLLLLILLFIPMQWGAPAGFGNVYKPVVEIVPNVTGEVIEVPIRGLRSMKKGDVLFKIDPTPYAATVDQLRAQLADTQQTVKQLAPQKVVTQSEVDRAEVQRMGLRKQLNLAEIELRITDDSIARSQADVKAAQANLSIKELRLKQLVETVWTPHPKLM